MGVTVLKEMREKSFEKKQELIDAAIEEFGEKGYEKASLNSILKAAGISKGAFYYHFDNKESLYFHLIGMFIEEKKRFFANNIKAEDFDKNIFELLEAMTETGLKFAKRNPSMSRFSEAFIKERGNEIYNKILEKFSFQSTDYFDILIENAYLKGELRQDIPIEFIKHIITYLLTHLQDITDIKNVDDFESAINYLIEFMKNGLGKK